MVVAENEGEDMLKMVAAIVGVIFLLAGLGVAVVHYTVESSGTMKFVTLAIAAALLVVGWALLDWGKGVSRRWGADKSKGNGPKSPGGGGM
jgi:uncharacterized membrane protein